MIYSERMERLKRRALLANGDILPDLVLTNGKVINVFNGKIIEGNIAIDNGKIIGIGNYEAKEKVDLFFKMMGQKEKLNSEEMKKLGDAVLMEYVANMPARIKCATLSWHSMKVIIEKKEEK